MSPAEVILLKHVIMGQLIKGITSSIPSFASCTSQKSKQTKLLPTNHQHHFHPTRKHHQPTLIFIHFWIRFLIFQNGYFEIHFQITFSYFAIPIMEYEILFQNSPSRTGISNPKKYSKIWKILFWNRYSRKCIGPNFSLTIDDHD